MRALADKIKALDWDALSMRTGEHRYVRGLLDEVLRIVAEHEQEHEDEVRRIAAAARIAEFEYVIKNRPIDPGYWDKHRRNELIAGMEAAKGGDAHAQPSRAGRNVTPPPVGQAGGEPKRWDKSQPADQIPAYLCVACNLEVEVGETFGSCPKCGKPMEMNPRWMAKPAEVEQMAGGRVE